MFGRLGSMFGRLAGGSASGTAALSPIPQSTLFGLFGPPRGQLDPTQDHILSDIFSPPYRGPGDLDNYGGETPEMRRRFRTEYHEGPVLRAALRGKADDICCLEPTVLAGNKSNPESNEAAEFLKWTVSLAPGGWSGLIDAIYTPGSIDGWSIAEKKLKLQDWSNGIHTRRVWGLAHVRSLDTVHIRLQLDVHRNVVGIVNVLRGLEYYDPSQVILYSHNPLFANPFGHSDARPALSASTMIADVYKIWYVALKVYGLPYMKGKVSEKTTRKQMEAALQSLRAGGYIAINKDDEIEAINLASAAAINGFESIIHTKREDIFFAIRRVAQPYMEGDGGADSHTDTGVQQQSGDASEKMSAHMVADVINRQLVPWLIGPNFQLSESEMPRVKLGGTNWKQVETILAIIEKAENVGMEPSAEWAHEVATIPAARDENDKLKSLQQKQQEQQQAAQQGQQAAQQAAPTTPVGSVTLPQLPPPPQPSGQQPAATFSADHRPEPTVNGVTSDQMGRVLDGLLREGLPA